MVVSNLSVNLSVNNILPMLNAKFYLDTKYDKNFDRPLHLVLRQKNIQVKVSIGEKIKKKDWDNKSQVVKDTNYNHKGINKFLLFLHQEVEKHFESTPHSQWTGKKIYCNKNRCGVAQTTDRAAISSNPQRKH